MRSKFDDIKRVQKFSSLGENLTQNINEKEAIEERARSMEAAFRLYQKTCKSKSLSYRVKIRRYNSVVNPECGWDNSHKWTLGRVKEIMEVFKQHLKELKSDDKSLDSVHISLDTKPRVYEKLEKILTTIKRRRMVSCGHLRRMKPERRAWKILNFLENR